MSSISHKMSHEHLPVFLTLAHVTSHYAVSWSFYAAIANDYNVQYNNMQKNPATDRHKVMSV